MARSLKRKASESTSSAALTGKEPNTQETAKKRQKVEPTASSTRSRRSLPISSSAASMTRTSPTSTPIPEATSNLFSKTKETVKHSPPKKAVGRPKKSRPQIARSSAIKQDELKDHEDHQPADASSENKDEEHVIDDNQVIDESLSVAASLTKKKAKSKAKANAGNKAVRESEEESNDDGRQFWLMKAEPESRIEKGKDVKFSIDDLEAAATPEPWDGVRNLEARNNLRAMTKGDLAFFYHSNCKVPGIVGIMEIVQEHTVDESAFDLEHPYYDEKSSRKNPKWHMVHVAFRRKFPEIIKLKDLQKFSKERGQLENMQTLKRTRLSVSKVTKKEWDFITSLVDEEDTTAAPAQRQPQTIAENSEAVAQTNSKGDQVKAINGNAEGMKSDPIAPTEMLNSKVVA